MIKADHNKRNENGEFLGVIKTTFETAEQKEKVVRAKFNLRKSEKYRNVYIEEVMTHEEIRSDNNLRTIIREIGCDKKY